jgi:hypothetical protein
LLIKRNAGGIATPMNQLFEHIDQIITEIAAFLGDKSCYSAHDVPLLVFKVKAFDASRYMLAYSASWSSPASSYSWNE